MKKLIYFFLFILCSFPMHVLAAEKPDIAGKAAIAVEYDTGKILYDKEAEKRHPIASLTKLITIYLTLEEIEKGHLQWDDQITISQHAKNLAENPEISNPHFTKDTYSVKELVDSSLIFSSNSSAIALAERIDGSESKFVDRMRELLKEWKISDFVIVNASGLNNNMLGDVIYPGSDPDAENEMSARDLAIVARHLIQDFPDVLSITSQNHMIWGDDDFDNSNLLLPGQSMARVGVDGLKTGTTEKAGYTFVATAKQDDMRIITVILNADGASKKRFSETNRLLDYCFATYEKIVIPKGHVFKKMITIKNGKVAKVSVKTKDNLTVVKLKGKQKIAFNHKLSKDSLIAPIKKGQLMGTISIKDHSPYIEKVNQTEIYASESIKETNIIDEFLQLFKG